MKKVKQEVCYTTYDVFIVDKDNTPKTLSFTSKGEAIDAINNLDNPKYIGSICSNVAKVEVELEVKDVVIKWIFATKHEKLGSMYVDYDTEKEAIEARGWFATHNYRCSEIEKLERIF